MDPEYVTASTNFQEQSFRFRLLIPFTPQPEFGFATIESVYTSGTSAFAIAKLRDGILVRIEGFRHVNV